MFTVKKSFLLKFFYISMLSLMMIGPSIAETFDDIHKDLDENMGDSGCLKCHSSHQGTISEVPQKSSMINVGSPELQNIRLMTDPEVTGNITIVTSVGQNWLQQGIFGPNQSDVTTDKSWGWTFFDEIYISIPSGTSSGYMSPPEKMTQRNSIYALLLDSGNNSNPIKNAQVTADVTYWIYDGVNYTNQNSQIQLTEDSNHSGLYSGIFYFYGGQPGGGYCGGCHPIHGGDTNAGYFPGNYTANITAQADNKIATSRVSFEVTAWGCEDCHGSGNPHQTKVLGIDSYCYLCHGVNELLHRQDDAGNPHQNTAHRTIQCTDCHTGKAVNSHTFNGVTFAKGGIDNNRSLPQYNYVATELNTGTHINLSCVYCHDDLALPGPSGGYRADNYTIKSTVNNYTPSFASIQQFQDYYVINVAREGPLNVTLDWEGTSNIGFYLYPPDFNPGNRTTPFNPDEGDYPYYNGSTMTKKPEDYTNNTPMSGKWILAVYGYDFIYSGGLRYGQLQSALKYTINTTYPIQRKDLPTIPECNSCHNSDGTGRALTTDNIPDWNPGFAHVDTNNDGTPDIQCRMCHDAMHEITVKDCRTCHTTAPVNHPIKEPEFAQRTISQCLECHGDPHQVTSAGGTDCIACHSPKDVNISKFARHADINTSDGGGNATNFDCWTCHYQKDMNRSNVYLCEACHSNTSGVVHVNDTSLVKNDFMHGMTTCRACHAPTGGSHPGYHQNGTVGPLGLVDNILRKMIAP